MMPNQPTFEFEQGIWASTSRWSIGIDEAGRGPLAGPVVVAALAFTPELFASYLELEWVKILNDSKKLSEKKRVTLYQAIIADKQLTWSIAIIDAPIIDEINILEATTLGMNQCAQEVTEQLNQQGIQGIDYLIDGNPVKNFKQTHQAIVKGDSKSLSIAAASILAKVKRDELMHEAAEKYPQYAFDKHKGYGTKIHKEALENHGACALHRMSFAPVAATLKKMNSNN